MKKTYTITMKFEVEQGSIGEEAMLEFKEDMINVKEEMLTTSREDNAGLIDVNISFTEE